MTTHDRTPDGPAQHPHRGAARRHGEVAHQLQRRSPLLALCCVAGLLTGRLRRAERAFDAKWQIGD
jgi:hypothetical protein